MPPTRWLLTEATTTKAAAKKRASAKVFSRFFSELLQRGVYIAPSPYEVGFVSTAHSEEDIDATVSAIDSALKAALV